MNESVNDMKTEETTIQFEKNPLGYEKVGKLLKGFAVPSIIAMLVSNLYNLVDQIFIGQGVGYLGNAATNVSFPLVTICLAMTLAIAIGSATQFSLALGRKEEDEAARVVGNGVMMMFTFGFVYAILVFIFASPLLSLFGATTDVMPYAMDYTKITAFGMPFIMIMNGMSNLARADGSPKFSMVCMVIGAVINTVLDPIFIFGFHWGVAGAAVATIIGQIASAVYALTYLKKFKTVRVRRQYFRLSFKRIKRTFVMGMSNCLTQLAVTLLQIIINNSMVYYGAMTIYGSDIPLAAAGVVMKINGLWMAVVVGLSQGSQPIYGFNYGAKKYARVRETYRKVITIDVIFSACVFAVYQLFPRVVLSLFGTGDELYMEFSVLFLRLFVMMVVINGVQMLSSNFLAAIGQPLKGAFLSLTRSVIFLIPLLLILPRFLGMTGILISPPIADFSAFIVIVFVILKQMRIMKQQEKELGMHIASS